MARTVELGIQYYNEYEHFYASSQADCDGLSTSTLYTYKFNKEACACFFEFTFEFNGCDPDTEKVNPFKEPFSRERMCITFDEYDKIFDHDFGPDCLFPTSEDE